ncbi:hypothetical protein FB45DRAFT_216178 [Roridomyces roridus]|uniref:Uncharacterized protein n=1 Tax=Roridomyces roridus TaxID=1738132 RepID=A0AAD7BDQ1_9AGAR|nr:hypothetical protein FB45DRAFT_216178 [Roridomyces roridus]
MSVFLKPMSTGTILGKSIPNDVLNSLLCASPDFGTLFSAVAVCKTWHRVFHTYPQSVKLSVAHNVVGPALHQAVRFLRYPYPEKTPNEWGSPDEDGEDDSATEDESVTESDSATEDTDYDAPRPAKKRPTKSAKPPKKKTLAETTDIGLLTPRETTKLEENGEIVGKLEALFASRATKTDKLTSLQSYRFHRAMYRVMLYCELFYLPLNLDDIDSMEDEPDTLEQIQTGRRAMLDEYATSELLELRAVVAFLHQLIGEVVDRQSYDRLKDICLATGPAAILEAYSLKSEERFEEALECEVLTSGEDNALFSGFVSKPLKKILKARGAVLPESASEFDAILDEAEAPPDKCAQCATVSAPKLWNESNHDKLITIDFSALLVGQLNSNDVETGALVDLFMGPSCGADVVVSEIYALKTAEYAKWNKGETLCTACLHELVGAHLHLWLYKRKVRDGWKRTPNCWYGYNCRTQKHKRSHAEEKNHLCAPTR